MAVTLADANTYFNDNVVRNEEWIAADDSTKTRALNQASKILYRVYSHKYDATDDLIPEEAIFEQALWLLRIDDSIRRAEQGVTTIRVDGASGVHIELSQINRSIAPEVLAILGRRVGRTSGARAGYVVRR